MPKPINENIGECACPVCSLTAAVRKMKNNGRLYLHCPECHTMRPTGQQFQDYILENATMYGPDGPAPEPEQVPEPVPVPPEPVPEPVTVENPQEYPAPPEPEPEPPRARTVGEELDEMLGL